MSSAKKEAVLIRTRKNSTAFGVSALRKILSLFFLMILLVSCQSVSDSSHITEEDVVKALQENGVPLVATDFRQGNVFGSELRKVKPGTYTLHKKPFFIYEFKNEDDVEKGIREFAKKTETMELVPSSIFEKRNILLFYVHEQEVDSDILPLDREIQEALDRISEG